MSVYTVHQPPLRAGEVLADPDRFVFVRDGFYLWAFLLTPLWFLLHRLWLVFLLYLALSVVVGGGLYLAGATAAVKFVVWLLIGLLAGFEAATLQRWTLTRSGWNTLGVVVGDDVEAAERRFFAFWVEREHERPAESPVLPPPLPVRGAPQTPDVIGWFPEPGAPR